MGIPKKLLMAVAASFAMLLPVFAPAAFAQNVPSTVQVVGTCGLSISPGTISYGSLAVGATSSDHVLGITNTGTAQGQVTLAGTNWVDGSGAARMGASSTHSGTPGTLYGAKAPVSTSATPIATLNPGVTMQRAFQLQIVNIDPAFTGTLSQTLTFGSLC